jgi:hypothetical protein
VETLPWLRTLKHISPVKSGNRWIQVGWRSRSKRSRAWVFSITYPMRRWNVTANRGLAIYVHPANSRPPTLQPAVDIDGSDHLNPLFAFAARMTFADLGGYRSERRNDFVAGSTYGIRSEYFHPFTPLSNWFVAPSLNAETSPLDFYRRSRIVALDREHRGGAPST